MLRVQIALENWTTICFPETVFICPVCGYRIKFFSICPRMCTLCLNPLPDVKAMQMLKNARLHYYLNGTDYDTDNS